MTGNEPCLEHIGPLIDAILFFQAALLCGTLLQHFCFSVAECLYKSRLIMCEKWKTHPAPVAQTTPTPPTHPPKKTYCRALQR